MRDFHTRVAKFSPPTRAAWKNETREKETKGGEEELADARRKNE